MPRILDRAVLGAQLLAEADGAGGTCLHTLAAGDALLGVALGGVGGGGEVRGVEELGGAQRVADADRAVADAEDLVFTVNVGDLVDIAAVLGLLENLHRLFVGDVAAVVGLAAVVGEVADADAPVGLNVAGAFAEDALLLPAGTDGDADVAFVLLQPVGQMLNGQGLALRGDGLLHGDDVHADAGAAGRNKLRNAGQREVGHALEEMRGLGEHVRLIRLDDHDLGAAGNEHVENPALLMVGVLAVKVLPVVLHQAALGDRLQGLLQVGVVELRILGLELGEGHGNALLHGERNIQNVFRHLFAVMDRREFQRGVDAEILRGVRGNGLAKHGGIVVGDLSRQFCDFLVFGHDISSILYKSFHLSGYKRPI